MKHGRFLTPEERERFLDAFSAGNHFSRYRTPHRDYVLARLVLATGLKVGEVIALCWRHVDLDEGRLAVVDDAGYPERILRFPEEVADLLRGWREREDGPPPSDPVFTTREGNPVHRNQVWAMVHRRGEKAGIDGSVNPTALRDTFAADLLQRTGNPHLVQEALGYERYEDLMQRYKRLLKEIPGQTE